MSLEVGALRALAHPVRLRMLSLLTGTAMSATEIAGELDITQANASYHLRALLAAGHVVIDSEERIRGGVAKRYRHPWDAEQPSRPSNDDDFALYVQAMAGELVRRSSYRRSGEPPASYTDAELWVPPEVWTEIVELVERASTMLHASALPPRTGDSVHVNMSAALFGMRDAGGDE